MRWVALLYTVLHRAGKSPLGIGRGRGNRPDDASATGPHGARCQAGRAPARTMVSDTKGSLCQPHTSAVHSAAPSAARGRLGLRPLLRTARARLRPRGRPARSDPREHRRRPALALALRAAAAGRATGAGAARPRLHAARRRTAAGRRARRRRAVPQARHRQPDALVQGPGRRRRVAKAQELGLEALACASTGNLANAVAARAAVEGMPAAIFCPADVEREKLLASAAHGATIYAVRGNYDACSRLTIELSFELPWAFVNVTLRAYYAEGSKTLAYEVVEQLGWELPDVVVVPVASGSLLTSGRSAASSDFRALGLVDGPAPRLIGVAAQGCSPVATAFAEGRDVSPCGRTPSRGRSRSGTRPTATRRSRRCGGRAERSTPWPRTRSARTCCCSPRPPACSARRRRASRSGRCGPRSRTVTSAPRDRVVLFVTGDGLKTLEPVGTARARSRSSRTPMRSSMRYVRRVTKMCR